MIGEAEAWEAEQRLTGADLKLTSTFAMTHFNTRLVTKERDYNNPLIVEKFIEDYAIDETGTNYPTEVFNPRAFEEGEYFEALALKQTELLQAQQEEFMRKKKQQDASRQQIQEARVQRIAELTHTDVKMVEETIAQSRATQSRFDSVVPNNAPPRMMGF